MQKTFTGWHMFAILAAFFGVVTAVNLLNAHYAGATFGGEVVENSYVASQQFNGWLDQARAEKALGWSEVTTWRPDGRLVVAVKDAPAGVTVSALAQHRLGRLPDQSLNFAPIGHGQYLSREVLPEGRWDVRLTITGAGHTSRREEYLP